VCGYREADATCMSCYNGFIDGTVSTQADNAYYAALRERFVTAGITLATYQYTVTGIAYTGGACAASCTFDGTYAAGTWATDATCMTCYVTA